MQLKRDQCLSFKYFFLLFSAEKAPIETFYWNEGKPATKLVSLFYIKDSSGEFGWSLDSDTAKSTICMYGMS